jgi:hypothetical protein
LDKHTLLEVKVSQDTSKSLLGENKTLLLLKTVLDTFKGKLRHFYFVKTFLDTF